MTRTLSASILVGSLLLLPLSAFAADAGSSTATEYVKDSVITTKIKAELAAQKIASLIEVNVDTDQAGAVTLSGSTKTKADQDKAVSIARGVAGVTSVKNDIKVGAAK